MRTFYLMCSIASVLLLRACIESPQHEALNAPALAKQEAQPKLNALDQQTKKLSLKYLQYKSEESRILKRRIKQFKRDAEHYRVPLSNDKIFELTELMQEELTLKDKIEQAYIDATKLNAGKFEDYHEQHMNSLPIDLKRRNLEVKQQQKAILAPLRAAKSAENIRRKMEGLSRKSGVPISSKVIAETIALDAEKNKIHEGTRTAAHYKWLDDVDERIALSSEKGKITEDWPVFNKQPLPNDVDYMRLKEIEVRLKEISAPMME